MPFDDIFVPCILIFLSFVIFCEYAILTKLSSPTKGWFNEISNSSKGMQFLEFKNIANPLSEIEVELKFKILIFYKNLEFAISINALSVK